MRTVSFVLCALAVASVTLAQTPVILSGPPQLIWVLPDRSLAQSLEMVGCNPGWLSSVVSENKIPASRLGTSALGGRFTLPPGIDCRTPAPPEVTAMSKALLATRAATVQRASLQNTISRLEGEVASLTADVATAKASIERAQADERSCSAARAASDSQLQVTAQERDSLRNELAARWSALSGFLLGIVLSTVICIGVYYVRRRRDLAA